MKNIFIYFCIIWMAVIFIFSSHTAEESTEDSSFVEEIIGKIFVKDFEELPEEEQEEFYSDISFAVRKLAHFTEYTILGILLINAGLYYKKRWLYTAAICFAIGSAYAASDEIHQLFVPGRAGLVTDWMIDSAGVLTGVLLVSLVSWVRRKKKAEPKEQ